MSKKIPRVCPTCKKHFEAYVDRQLFCSRPCYLIARRGGYVPPAGHDAPEIVCIRLPKRLPVFPEFQLTPGKVYRAEKRRNTQTGHATYIVTLDKARRTIVRPDECEEVDHE